MFAIDFCSQPSLYRLSLPSDIADEPVLLLLDGHISRRNTMALTFFNLFNVDILIVPGHTTHVLQPFNVWHRGAAQSIIKTAIATRNKLVSGITE
jgi:hypothetical protein